MSMKIVLKKLTSMVLVICMFLSLSAPAVGEAPLSLPSEQAVYPDGSTVYADGTVVYADGTIVYASGTAVGADGVKVNDDGSTLYPDGTTLYPDGKMVYADGTAVYPDGTTVYADGTAVYPDGTIMYADGTTVRADGVTVNADGTTVYPDGTTVYPDGTIVYADRTKLYPDGTVVYPDGTTLYIDGTILNPDGSTVYPDGTIVYADGTTVYPDGRTVYTDGSTLYADGTTVYADGTTLNPDGSTVYPDGTTVYADGTTVYADGTTAYPDGRIAYPDGRTVYTDGSTLYADGTVVYADGTTVYTDGTTVYADGTTVYADGTTVYPDGTTVYPDGSTNVAPAEEPAPAVEPEPFIPEPVAEPEEVLPAEPVVPTEPTIVEEPTEAADPVTPADPAEETEPAPTIAGKEAEEAENAGNTENQDAETRDGEEAQEPKEDTEKKTEENPEKTTEETAAPAEELPLRTLTASADQMAFRDQFLNPKEPVLWSGSVWNWLYGTAIEPAYTDDHVTVEIRGHLPETVTARAMFIEFADPGAAQNAERALMLLDMALLDETGAVYVPAEKLHVSVSAGPVYGAAENGEPLVAYFDDSYDGVGEAGDIKVRLDEYIDGSRLVYVPEQAEALRFWEAGGRLSTTENRTVDFDENRFPFRFVLSAQQEPVAAEEQPDVQAQEAQNQEESNSDVQPAEQENVIKDVMLSGTVVASDGYTYEVSVSYPANCGIPAGVQLSVEELVLGSDAYWAYINQSAAELGVSPAELSLARAFDISFVDPATGVQYQPTQDVRVSILLISTPVNTEEEITVLHFDDEAGEVQAMDVALNGETIEFETSGFSVFTVLQKNKDNNLMAANGTDDENGAGDGNQDDAIATVTITANSSTKFYGDADPELTATVDGLIGEDAVEYTLSREEGENPGEYVITASGEAEQGNYTVNYTDGTFTITKRALTITAASETKIYDGYELSNDGYSADGLAEGDSVKEIVVSGAQTDVNVSDDPDVDTTPNNMVRDARIVNSAGEDVTENYTITYLPGTLKVTKKPITITADNAEKAYDGTELTTDGYTSTGLADGDVFDSVTVTGSQTQVGESSNIPSEARIVRPTESDAVVDVNDNYDITYANGTLTVTKSELAITADSAEKVYDGTALTKETYTVEGLAEGDSIQNVTVTGSQTGAGESANVPTAATVVNSNGVDVSSCYSITYKNGTLEVTKKSVKLTANSGVEIYNGNEKTIQGFTVSADGRRLDGITFDSVSASGSGMEKGSYPVIFTGVTPNETTDTTGNYVVNETENGTLLITASAPLEKTLTFSGNIAEYTVTVNPEGFKLNGGNNLTLKDTFTENQSIDYSSVSVSSDVPYDFSGYTGTFTIPDQTPITITYKTRVAGAAGTTATFGNTAELGVTQNGSFDAWFSTTRTAEETITPTGTDIEGTDGVYTIRLYAYAQNHMEQGLGGAVFRLLDANQRPISYQAGEQAGNPVTFVTGNDGYVDVALDDGIVSIRKNTVYYLEMITAPAAKNTDGSYTYYQKDNTLYRFLITDDPSYTGEYNYFNGDVLKVRCYPESAGVNVTKRFSGNYSLTEEQKNQIRFVLQKEDLASGNWVDVESHTYAEFSYDSMNFDAGREGGAPLEQAVLYRLIEENDTIEGVDHSSSVTLSYQRDNEMVQENTNEFEVNPDHSTYSFSLVYDNSYVDHRLTLVKMNELTGELLAGAEFSVYQAEDSHAVKTYTTDRDGTLEIRRSDEGADYAPDTAYYVTETKAPDDYLMPKDPEKVYFYFSENSAGVPEGIPTGTTAVDLTTSYDTVTIDNRTETVKVPVTVTWDVDGVKTWPAEVDSIVVSLYQSVNGGEPEQVMRDGSPMTVTLNSGKTFDNTTFVDLPARDMNGNDIAYSVMQQELSGYYTSYKVSGTGWYVVRNELAVSVTVSKEWYDLSGNSVENAGDKQAVAFDLYRTTADHPEITTRADLENILRGETPVRTGLTLSVDNGWTNTVTSLQKENADGDDYYYFALECEDSMPRNNEDSYAVVPAGEGTLRTLTINNTQTPVTVIIKAQDLTKAYGQNDPEFTFTTEVQDDECTVTDPVQGEDGTYTVTVTKGDETKTITFTCSREEGEDVGSYTIELTGEASQEGYRVRLDNSTLTITRAQVTVKGTATKLYGDPDPALVEITGLKEGETISYYAYRDIGEQKGSYRITVTGLTRQGNYEITYINDYLTIEPAPVTVTADNLSKTYGQEDPTLTVTIDGLKNQDAASVIHYEISRAEGESVNEYPITVTGEEAQGNYTVIFVPGTFTVNGQKVTVRAKNLRKTYGESDPALEVEITGLSEGESVEYEVTREEGEDVGTYVITPEGDTAQGNYEVTFETGLLTIDRADLTVTPVNTVKALTDPITEDPQLTVTFDKLVNHDNEIEPTVTHEGNKWIYTYTREGETVPEFAFTLTRTPGETAGPYIIVAAAYGEQPKNYNITYKTGIFTILTTYNVVVNQQTRDLVDYTQNPEYTYTAVLDLSSIGIENYNAGDFKDNRMSFTLPADGSSSQTLAIPSGAKLTVTQDTENPDYTTAITLDTNPITGTTIEINPVNKAASIVVTHERITLSVEARASHRQTSDGKADENGAAIVTPIAYLGIPRDEEKNPIAQTAEDFIAGLDAQGVYNLPEDMYYVPEHASVYRGDTAVATNVQAIRYDAESKAWQYRLDGSDFTSFQAGEQLVLFYMPKYICRVQADGESFYTLNDALHHIRDNHAGTGAIEMLIDRYTMPSADALVIPTDCNITLTTADGLGTMAVILRKTSFSSGHMFNNDKGTLTLDHIIIDGNGVAANEAMVRNNSTLTVTGNAILQNASGNNGGALYVAGGSAAVEEGASFTGNTATNGGAIYYNNGSLSISTENITGNTATNGGAVYMASGTLEIAKSITGNSATNGGEVYISGGVLTIGGTVSGTATSGGAVFMTGGTVDVIGGTVSGSTAENGGAFYMEGGTLNISGGTVSGNRAANSGGMLYATGGNVNISGGTISDNAAENGNGGAICYTGPGTVTVSGGTLSGNSAENGLGGAIYQSSGESTLSAGNINGNNNAQNGAAIYTAGGITNFKGVSITGNIASEGGAVGMALGTKLNFSGNTTVSDNKNTDGEKRNVYLNVDSDEIINVPDPLGSNNIGIYVADNVRSTRGEACCSFGGYVSTTNLSKITDDRGIYTEYNYNNKLYWGKPVKFSVRYLPNGNGFPPNTASGTQLYAETSYYPKTTENQIYSLVNLLYDNYYSEKIKTGYVYAYTFRNGETAFDKYITSIDWDAEARQWVYQLHDRTTYTNNNNAQIVIYYADAAYISIINNSGYDLTIDPLTVMGKTAVSDGYGYTAVINNVTQKTLLPITGTHLTIPKDCSVRLLFPGAKGSTWSLSGTFTDAVEGSEITYTLDRAGGGTEQPLPTTTTEDGLTFSLNGNMLSSAGGIYEILFGDPTPICKVENNGVEFPFTSLNLAKDYIVSNGLTTATIEMLLDYQQPKNDILAIPEGYNITLTTAAAEGSEAAAGKTYTYVGDDPTRATISRSSGDMGAAVTSEIQATTAVLTNDQCTTSLTVDGIIFDGKALGQGGEGGAIRAANTIVNINHCDFKGYTATRGGAIYVKWGRLTVENCDFTNCKILSSQDKTGGGGIWTTTHDLTVKNCNFINCDCSGTGPQGGAVFHNIRYDGAPVHPSDSQKFPTGFSKDSTTWIENCTFMDCIAIGSGGTVESDAWFVDIKGCFFHGSQTTKSGGNGGAINIWTNDNKNITDSTYLNVDNCWFEDCSASNGNTNGGAIRTLCRNVKLSGTTFKNAFSNNTGGALSMTNTGIKLEIYGCTFENCRSNENSGAVYAKATTLTIGDSESYMDYNAETGYEVVSGTRHTSFTDCTSKKFGGINHDQTGDATITGTTFTRCTTTNESAGALYTKTKKLKIEDTMFINCTASSAGGALYNNDSSGSQVLTNCVFDGCTAGTNGGGAYLAAKSLTVSGTTVQNCEAVNNGGGIYTGTGGTGAVFTDCTFTNNRVTASEGRGGALYHNSNGLTFNGGEFEKNRAAYGGGIYHNGGAFNLNDAQISECFATISGGGIYHGNGTFKFNHSQISECYAVTSGGGIYSKNNLYAYGSIKDCAAGQGGGMYSDSKLYFTDTANAMTIENCQAKNVTLNEDGTVTVAESFSADNLGGGIYKKSDLFDMKSAMATVKGCSAYNGGGVYYNTSGTLTFSAGNFYGNTAANNGGAIYKNAGTINMSGSPVIGGSTENANHAQYGAAIFVADGQKITIGGGRITHNVAEIGGAVAVGGSNTNTQLQFQGAPVIKNNTNASGEKCNVYLDYDTNGIIRTSGTALSTGAYIGVYVSDEQFAKHGNYSMPFGTYSKTDLLSSFFNDRIYAGGKQGSSNNQIVWGEFICKITDGNGNLLYTDSTCEAPAVYTMLENNGGENTTSAFGMLSYTTPSLYNADGQYSGPYQIQMLVGDYNCTSQMKIKNGSKDITLTTASRTPDECGFYYTGAADQAELHRNANYGSMINTDKMSRLVIENITIDAASDRSFPSSENGGIVRIQGSTQVYLNENAILCNSNVGGKNGGAVYMDDDNGHLYINGAGISNCASTMSGGGICVVRGTITMSDGAITECSAKSGGGIYLDTNASLTMSGGSITGNSATAEAGGIDLRGEIHISGNPVINDNTLNGNPCNLHLINDNNTSIYAEGLGPFAEIRVYTSDTVKTKHGVDGKPFGTWTDNANLHCFINDLNVNLRGMKASGDVLIYWRTNPFLTVGKIVDSDWAMDKDEEFDFKVIIEGQDSFSGTYEDMSFTNGVAVFKLKAGQVKTASGLPFDFIHSEVNYTVLETLAEGQTVYDTQYRHNGGVSAPGNSVTGRFGENMSEDPLTSSSVSSVEFINTRQKDSLKVSKTVTDQITGDEVMDFAFTVTLDDKTITKTYETKLYLNQEDTEGITGTPITFTKGIAEFTLRHGQTLEILGLPKELGFKVEEKLTEDQYANFRAYVTAGSADEVLSYSASGNIGELKNVAFRNNRYGIVCKFVNDTEGREQLYFRENNNPDTDPVPAIFDELEKAFETISSGIKFFTVDGSTANQKLRLEMVKPRYEMNRQVTLAEDVTYYVSLGTAQKTDRLYPYPTDADPTAVVTRGFDGGSMIADEGNLTLDNITLDGGSDTYTAIENGGIVQVNNGQTLTVTNNATLRNSKSTGNGGAIWIGQNAGLIMNGSVTNCEAVNGGGVYAADSFGGLTADAGYIGVTIGGTISDCQATEGNGGAIYAGHTTISESIPGAVPLILTDTAKLNGNEAVSAEDGDNTGCGGAIFSAAAVAADGAVITGNSAKDGGGIYLDSDAAFTMTGGTVSSNTAKENGGGIYAKKISITDGIFAENSANSNGGAIYTVPEAVLTIDGENTAFTGNLAKLGGAVYDQGSTTMSAGTMTGNTATDKGGAVYVTDGNRFTMTGGSISDNSSPEGAVSTGVNAVLDFSRNAEVFGNTGSDGETAMNVFLGYHSNTIINASDLTGTSKIGVYVTDGEDELIYNNHGIANRPFGTGNGENLSTFINDRDTSLTGIQGTDGLIMWPGKDLQIQLYQNKVNEQGQKTTPVGGARFSLANEDGVTIWSGVSNASTGLFPGLITIPWGTVETENGSQATFTKQSDGNVSAVTYVLSELESGPDTVRPARTWTLTIETDNTVTWTVNPPELDGGQNDPDGGEGQGTPEEGESSKVNRTLNLEPESGEELGATFILYNDVKPTITFDPTGGILFGKEDTSTRTDLVDFTTDEFNHTYKVGEPNPTKESAVFRAWSTVKTPVEGDGHKEYKQGDEILFYRETDDDDVTLYALWSGVVCKITDRNDNLLYVNGSPAVYMSLKDGFDSFNEAAFTTRDGTKATPRKIKMLVSEYEMTETVELARGKTAEFMTASAMDDDGYKGPENTCVITRASTFDTGSMVIDNYNLVLRNITLDGSLEDSSGSAVPIKGAEDSENVGGIIAVTGNASHLTLATGAALRNAAVNGNGGAIYAAGNTVVTVSDGSITGCQAENGNGGAIYAEGTVNMSGGVVKDNSSAANGGGLYLSNDASFTMTGGSLTGNGAANGGGIYSEGGVVLSNDKAVVSGNTASVNGGGVYVSESGSLSLTAGSIGASDSPNTAASGSGVYLAGKATLTGGKISYNGAESSGDGGGIYLNTKAEITLNGTELSHNRAATGGAVYAVKPGDAEENFILMLSKGTISENSASVNGGGVYLASGVKLTMIGGTMSANQATNGGAAYVSTGSDMTLSGGTANKNMTSGNGAAVYVEGSSGEAYGTLSVKVGSINGNMADRLGGAVYLEDYGRLHVSGGTISENAAKAENGGAINVEGGNARIYLSGSPTIFNNPGNAATTAQKNLVLSVGQNNIINTEESGLKDKMTKGPGGMVGIYVIDDNGIYAEHGVNGKPFGTFGNTDVNRINAKHLVNDRSLSLHGVEKDGDIIYWQDVVCKVTDANDVMLYERVNVDNSGINVYAPAVYTSLKGGFDAVNGTLYRKSGSRYVVVGTGDVKVKMLKDYTLDDAEIINYTTARTVTLTTAETEITEAMKNNGDSYVFTPADGAEGDKRTKATLTRGQTSSSMFTVNTPGNSFNVTDLIIDGGINTMMTTEGIHGGGFNIMGVSSSLFRNVTLKNLNATGNGGAIYQNSGSLTLSNSGFIGNAAANGGAVYVSNGSNAFLSDGTVVGNTATGDGAGFYLAEGSKLKISGNLDFGRKTDANGTVLSPSEGGTGNYCNGGSQETRPQDIFIAGYTETTASSLVVAGDIICKTNGTEDESIWVWAAELPHYKTLEQFARIQDGLSVSEDTLKVFRNARPDSDTDNDTGSYLYGTSEGDTPVYVYWNGVKGSRKVILRKVSDKYETLPGAQFTIYRRSTPIEGTDINGDTTTSFPSGTSGVFYIDELNYGVYVLDETTAPAGYSRTPYYFLVVDEDGAEISDNEYDSMEAAQQAGDEEYARRKEERAAAQTTP